MPIGYGISTIQIMEHTYFHYTINTFDINEIMHEHNNCTNTVRIFYVIINN